MAWLKADFHIHTNKDKFHSFINYSPKDVIDILAEKGFEVAAITHHNEVFTNYELERYAKEKGIVLFSGCEKSIEGKHVLLINVSNNLAKKIKTFKDLARERKKHPEMIIIAAHPYLPIKEALHSKLVKNIYLFDGLEISHFYTRLFTFNTKTKIIAKKYNLPLIGTSDAHHQLQFGRTYSMINAEKNKKSIINAFKEGKVMCISKPLPILISIWLGIKMYLMSKKEEKLEELMREKEKLIKRMKKAQKQFKKIREDIQKNIKKKQIFK